MARETLNQRPECLACVLAHANILEHGFLCGVTASAVRLRGVVCAPVCTVGSICYHFSSNKKIIMSLGMMAHVNQLDVVYL